MRVNGKSLQNWKLTLKVAPNFGFLFRLECVLDKLFYTFYTLKLHVSTAGLVHLADIKLGVMTTNRD